MPAGPGGANGRHAWQQLAREILFTASGDEWNDVRDSEFDSFFDGPLHAIEFEDGDGEGDVRSGRRRDHSAKLEFNAVFLDGEDVGFEDAFGGCEVEVLAWLGAEDSGEMQGVFTYEVGAIGIDLVGEPAAAGHWRIVCLGIVRFRYPGSNARPVAQNATRTRHPLRLSAKYLFHFV